MLLRGIVQTSELVENPAGSGRIELELRVQGVGPGQPRKIVIPFELLLADEGLDGEQMVGRAFEAEVEAAGGSRWQVVQIQLAARSVLRPRS